MVLIILLLVSQRCVSLDQTLIYGSILGFEGQVAVLIIEKVKPERLVLILQIQRMYLIVT
jgi:molybdopterin/thiamine biosynthesis adenylyltransferase